MLGSSGSVPTSVLVEEFTEALAAVAFDRANIERQQNAVSGFVLTQGLQSGMAKQGSGEQQATAVMGMLYVLSV